MSGSTTTNWLSQDGGQTVTSSISVNETSLGHLSGLMESNPAPGSDLDYQTAKDVYIYHPLGRKMAESPVAMAQSQPRKITVQDAPDEVTMAFHDEWETLGCTAAIRNLKTLARVYGIASVVLVSEQLAPNKPLDMETLWEKSIDFNVLDPLNTAGSLVLDQIPTATDFNKVGPRITSNGVAFHRTRFQVSMNESPVYLAFTVSAFGFVGRSVYLRALYPLKSFVATMVADDMVARKVGLLVAKMQQPGSIIDGVMAKIANIKRAILKRSQTGNVLSIDIKESIETLNMMNVDGAGTFARNNILKNAATAADMPASFLNNETLVHGFGEGTEDAKNIAHYLDGMRAEMKPHYDWFDNIVQYRAWNPDFIARMKANYPAQYGNKSPRDMFSEWRANFEAEWPSFLIEPESEAVKVEAVRLESGIATVQTLIEQVGPKGKLALIQWLADTISENKLMFPHALEFDWTELESYLDKQQEAAETAAQASAEAAKNGGVEGDLGPEAKRAGTFRVSDSSRPDSKGALIDLRRRVESMQSGRVLADRSGARYVARPAHPRPLSS